MKNTTLLIITFLPLILSGCFSQRTKSEVVKEYASTSKGIDYCDDLLKLIVIPNWKEDETGQHIRGENIRCFAGTKEYWERAIIWNEALCFKGKSKKYIESILGKPNKERIESKTGNTVVHYSICNSDRSIVPVWHLQINYNKNLKVMQITESVTFVDID